MDATSFTIQGRRVDMEFTIVEEPFSWNDNLAEVALEDFSMIQHKLSYCTCQSIGMALAKLKLLEEQGCKVKGE
jgi:hypothetical protein